ncbi:MAG: B12-binding domain-containing radical SAM protein [Clostridia bacterium]|nr:B12-binding domain-containing radical SAM protein [Clostridia bacterium]
MNILLVNPPIPNKFKIFDYCDEEGRDAIRKRVLVGPPLALNELAGMLPEENVLIIDQKAEIDSNPSYDYIDELIKEINRFKPDIVSFTCLTAQYNCVIKLLETVKKVDSGILTSIGGIHPSSCPEDFVGSKADIISIGLGKHSYYHMVQEYKKNRANPDFTNIPGLALNLGDRLVYTRSLCDMSYKEFKENYLLDEVLPNRSLTDRYDYTIARINKRLHYISTSQGCTHKCNFCYLWKMTNGYYFHRNVESIINELKQMDRYYLIRFCDANTFGDIKKSKELFTRIIEEGLNLNHAYMGDVRTDTVIRHPDLLELAAKAGLKVTVCGLEATNDEELKKYGKDCTTDTIREALKILNECGIYVNGNFIVRPDYEEKDFEGLARFIEDNPIYNAALTILTPFPGTEQWNELKDQIVEWDYDYFNLTNSVLKTRLPEDVFYKKISEVYKVSAKSGRKFMEMYGEKNQRAV